MVTKVFRVGGALLDIMRKVSQDVEKPDVHTRAAGKAEERGM